MAIRIDDLPIDDTRALMARIMPLVKQGERVLFLCPKQEGENIVQRIRVMMSRVRKKLRNQNKKIQHFKVHHTVHPHTEDGHRFDAVVIWSTRSESHEHAEMLEDLLRS